MLQVQNHSPFAAFMLVTPDTDGVESVYTVVKGTFLIGEQLTVADEQIPVTLKDEYWGEPQITSLKAPADTTLEKPGTDILLHGSAWAPGGEPTTEMTVSVNVAGISKTVVVTGNRKWEQGLLGATLSSPQPFESMPLVWERAYGGFESDPENDKHDGIMENPVGVGFQMDGIGQIEDVKVPNIELESERIRSVKDRPRPAGFAAVGPNYEPRISFAGTYDEAWERSRMPFLPNDFDSRFFQSAPEDQVVQGFLTGSETVTVKGASPDGMLEFQLPGIIPSVVYTVASEKHEVAPNLDTVLIEPDEMRVSLVWRACLRVDKRMLQVKEVTIDLSETESL